MPKIVHFEINAEDTLRAKSFYEKVFNWKIEKFEGPMDYFMIIAGSEEEEGINGGLQKRENASDEIFNYIGVPSVDEFCKKIEKNGGEILTQKSPIPGIGYHASFKDTEGNRLGIFEANESAK